MPKMCKQTLCCQADASTSKSLSTLIISSPISGSTSRVECLFIAVYSAYSINCKNGNKTVEIIPKDIDSLAVLNQLNKNNLDIFSQIISGLGKIKGAFYSRNSIVP